MKYLKIKNNGVLDIRLVSLMGGTTKSSDEFKIGQFGSGLKYTLAYLIRNNLAFHIFAGEEEIKIKIEQEEIQAEVFNIICINGHRTSITDRMGLDWKAWMIIRELWCNALDEGGSEYSVTDTIESHAGCTCFYIQISSEIKEVLDNWNKYFIHDQKPLWSSDFLSIYPGGNALRIYKQGVLIHEVEKQKCIFSYDIKNAKINELREYIGSTDYAISRCLQNPDVSIINHFLEIVTDDHHEANIELDWYSSFGDNWKAAIGEAKLIHKEAMDNIKARGIKIDISNVLCVPKKIYESLTKQFEGIGALRVSSKLHEFYEIYSTECDEKIKQALVILEEAGYNFSPEIKFTYGVFGAKDICAQIHLDTKECLISENILQKSLFEVVYILIEENEHLKTGFEDCSRSFQTHFLRLYAQQLLAKAKIAL
jgi:hypothetical protein